MTATLNSQTFEEACHSFLKDKDCEYVDIESGFVFYKNHNGETVGAREEILANMMIAEGLWKGTVK